MRSVIAQYEHWTPEYVSSMPISQLIAWSKGVKE
jgi:hypothetical protein